MIGGNFAICLIAYSMIVQTQCEIYIRDKAKSLRNVRRSVFCDDIRKKMWRYKIYDMFFKVHYEKATKF